MCTGHFMCVKVIVRCGTGADGVASKPAFTPLYGGGMEVVVLFDEEGGALDGDENLGTVRAIRVLGGWAVYVAGGGILSFPADPYIRNLITPFLLFCL